jgi:hypothetical protein
MVQVGSQKYERMFKKIIFILFCSQIWLNLFFNQWHFGSNTKLATWNKVHFQVMCKTLSNLNDNYNELFRFTQKNQKKKKNH